MSDDPMSRPRYTGIPTFMRAPYAEDWSGVDIGLIGVPYDGGVTNRPGTRHGPREIRNLSSLMRKVNQATGVGPKAALHGATRRSRRSAGSTSARTTTSRTA